MQLYEAVDTELFFTLQETTVAGKSVLYAVSDLEGLAVLVLTITPEELQKKKLLFSNRPDMFCVADKTSLCLYISLGFCLELLPNLGLICFCANDVKTVRQAPFTVRVHQSELAPKTEACISGNLGVTSVA